MNHEIIKTESGKYALIVEGQTIAEYTRKADAKRGYARLCAKSGEMFANAQTDSREAAAGCAVAQTPPTSNTGGLVGAETQAVSESYAHCVTENGKVKQIPLRRGVGTAAHIDTLTLTFRSHVLIDGKVSEENKQQLAESISSTLFSLFGFGLYEERSGINGYKYSYRMGTDNANYGFAAFGGKRQRDSICLHFSGEGLTAAVQGWESRLYSWLSAFAPYARITRCDLAHDFLQGEYTPDQAYHDWLAGGFTAKHTRPRARKHGYDWLDDQRTGKTFYVGTTNSSRLVRVYEKGCEQGDYTSPWVRVELQLRNRDYIIPHDILIAPGEYLTGAYPVFEQLFAKYAEDCSHAERVKQTAEISFDHVLKYASMQASPCINMLEYLGFDDKDIVRLLKAGKYQMPKRLNPDKISCEDTDILYLHQLTEKKDIYIADYMRGLHKAEQEAATQAYFDKLEQDAMQHRMSADYQSFGRFL